MIAKEVHSMVATQAVTLRQQLLPALRNHGVRILTYAELSTRGAYGYAVPTQATQATQAEHITTTLSEHLRDEAADEDFMYSESYATVYATEAASE